MNTYEINQVKRAIEIANGTDAYYGRPHSGYVPHKRQWDYIIRMVCSGCGKTLGKFEVQNHLAFCFRCRVFLFPETITQYSGRASKPLHPM